MTDREIKTLDTEVERMFKALLNVERHTGIYSTQSIVARAQWWGAQSIVQIAKDKFLHDQNAPMVREINSTKRKGE